MLFLAGSRVGPWQELEYYEALRLSRAGGGQGNAAAQNSLGFLYANGKGATQDYAEALRARTASPPIKASQRPRTTLDFSIRYDTRTAQDYTEAMRWYRLAANQGSAVGARSFGMLYVDGRDVSRDTAEARTSMTKAAAGGDDTAKKWPKEN